MSQTTEIPDEAPEGYKQVQLGPRTLSVPTDWGIRRVDEITENLDRKREPIKSSERKSGDVPYYGATGQVDSVSGHLFDEKLVLVGEDGADWSPFGGTSYIISGKTWVNNHVHVLRCTNIVEEFLSNYLDYIEMRQVISGTNRGKLNQSELNQFPVLYPPLPEQHHIADIISTIDKQIQQTDEIIGKRRELRQGLLQELFHRGTVEHERILDPEELADQAGGVNTGMDQTTVGQIPEEWETERLGELTENSAYGVNASAEAFDPDKPRYLRITDIADDGHLKQDDPKSISRDVSEGYELKPGDLVFARTGATVGKTLLYQEGHPEATYAGYLIRFQLDQTRILPKFAFYFTQTGNYDRWVSRITRQGAQENINTGEYCSILLPLPPIAEQQEIVSILETIDSTIEEERKTKEALQDLKRGLMQDLLTGKVRVNPDG